MSFFERLGQIAARVREAQAEAQAQALREIDAANARARGAQATGPASALTVVRVPPSAAGAAANAPRRNPMLPQNPVAPPAPPGLPPAEAAFAIASPSRSGELLAAFSGREPLLAGIVLAEALAPPVALRASQLFDPRVR